MKVFIFVEGESDRLALNALWEEWREKLRLQGHGIQIIPLVNKDRYFRKIGPYAAMKLAANNEDLVVGLPDLYPNDKYSCDNLLCHATYDQLRDVQRRLVKEGLCGSQEIRGDLSPYLERFYPCALKHDLEMLLLAAVNELRDHLNTQERLTHNWCLPVEEQNQIRPPKRIVEELYRTKKKRAYRDTKDAPAVLRKVRNMNDMIFCNGNIRNCPVFAEMLDWIGSKTGVSAY